MVLCCLLYALWWCMAFRPGVTGGVASGGKGLLLGLTFLFAFVAVLLDILGIRSLEGTGYPSPLAIALAGVASYIVLLGVTSLAFHRLVTTELLLIVAWAALETAAVFAAYGSDALAGAAPTIPLALIAAATILSLIAYLFYYKAAPWTAFYLGLVPLLAYAAATAAIAFSMTSAASSPIP